MSAFQREILSAIFTRSRETLFLTGVAALAARLPAGVQPVELRAFIEDLVVRLRRAAYP